MGFLIWDIRTTTDLSESLTLRSENANQTRTLNSSSIVGQITSTDGFFINGTITIMRPINLNGSTITCNRDQLTLNIPTRSGKFLSPTQKLGRDRYDLLSKMLMCTSVLYLNIYL